MNVIEIDNPNKLPAGRLYQVVSLVEDLENAVRIYQMRRGIAPEVVYHQKIGKTHNYWMGEKNNG